MHLQTIFCVPLSLKTWRPGNIFFADYFDDPLYELLTQFNLDHDVELVGKEIETIPSDLFIRSEAWAKERSKQPFASAWLYPWLRKVNKKALAI